MTEAQGIELAHDFVQGEFVGLGMTMGDSSLASATNCCSFSADGSIQGIGLLARRESLVSTQELVKVGLEAVVGDEPERVPGSLAVEVGEDVDAVEAVDLVV